MINALRSSLRHRADRLATWRLGRGSGQINARLGECFPPNSAYKTSIRMSDNPPGVAIGDASAFVGGNHPGDVLGKSGISCGARRLSSVSSPSWRFPPYQLPTPMSCVITLQMSVSIDADLCVAGLQPASGFNPLGEASQPFSRLNARRRTEACPHFLARV